MRQALDGWKKADLRRLRSLRNYRPGIWQNVRLRGLTQTLDPFNMRRDWNYHSFWTITITIIPIGEMCSQQKGRR